MSAEQAVTKDAYVIFLEKFLMAFLLKWCATFLAKVGPVTAAETGNSFSHTSRSNDVARPVAPHARLNCARVTRHTSPHHAVAPAHTALSQPRNAALFG